MGLEEAAKPGFFLCRAIEVLKGKIPDDFRPDQIDSRLYWRNRIMSIGLGPIDSRHPDLQIIDSIIRAIRNRILKDDLLVT